MSFRRAILAAALVAALPASAADYVGSDVCKSCHPAQHAQWLTTSHASSMSRLTASQQRDRGCRTCHTMDPAVQEAGLTNVQCESCHGPGALYSQRYVMKDKVLARLLGLSDITPSTCAPCHGSESPSVVPYEFPVDVLRVKHGPSAASTRLDVPRTGGAEGELGSGSGPRGAASSSALAAVDVGSATSVLESAASWTSSGGPGIGRWWAEPTGVEAASSTSRSPAAGEPDRASSVDVVLRSPEEGATSSLARGRALEVRQGSTLVALRSVAEAESKCSAPPPFRVMSPSVEPPATSLSTRRDAVAAALRARAVAESPAGPSSSRPEKLSSP